MFARLLVIGNADSPRVLALQKSLVALRLAPALLITYADLLSGKTCLQEYLKPGAIVRIESPGRHFETEKEILKLGAKAIANEAFESIEPEALADLRFDKGRILAPRQWYLGFSELLRDIQLQVDSSCMFMNHPDEIAMMFDKLACQSRFLKSGLPVPQQFGLIHSFEELDAILNLRDCSRAFLKLTHGSSASGIIAYRRNRGRHQAVTTIETVLCGGVLHLYNSRRVRTLDSLSEIKTIVDAICRHRVCAEEWLPKANYRSMSCDLRVLVVAGQVQQIVLRKSASPFTNLHLLNEREVVDDFKQSMGADAWQRAMITCVEAAACFPRSHYAGVDLLVLTGMRKHAIAEINAFGDQLNKVLVNGKDSYTIELESLLAGSAPWQQLQGAGLR